MRSFHLLNDRNSVRSGVIWNTLGSGMMAANSVLMLMAVSRTADLDTVGAFSISLTTSQLLYVVALFAVNDFQMTDYDHEYSFHTYSRAKGLTSLLCVVCCAACIFLLGFSASKVSFTVLLTAFMLVNSLGEMYQSQFFQYNRVDLAGKAQFFRYLFSTACFLLGMILGCSIAVSCLFMITAGILATWIWCFRPIGAFIEPDTDPTDSVRQLLTRNIPLFLSVLSSLVVINAPKYIINAVSSDEIQGIFGILFMPTSVINLVSMFIYKPFLIQYAAVIEENDSRFPRLLLQHASLVFAFSVFCAGLMWVVGIPFLKLLFGVNLAAYRTEMMLFMFAGGVMALNQLLYYLLVILRKQKSILLCYTLGVIVAIASGMVMIQKYEVRGAFYSFALSQLVMTGIYGFILGRYRIRSVRGGH
ncbi:MAG: lipopolysaccharide biosynthesis protein [Anaerolineaceae bacterium]|nr:lipopolysaccharide biosynthesis protein [Anaerolineaceae bacterium]